MILFSCQCQSSGVVIAGKPAFHHIISSWNVAYNVETLWRVQQSEQNDFLLAFFPLSARPNALTLYIRYSVLFAFDSDMIIASLPGFKVIFYLSSEQKIFYWRSGPTVKQYECDNDILQQWEHRFCSLLNPLHSPAPEPKWSVKLDDAGLVTEKTLYGVHRWEQGGEQNVCVLSLEWPSLVMFFHCFLRLFVRLCHCVYRAILYVREPKSHSSVLIEG